MKRNTSWTAMGIVGALVLSQWTARNLLAATCTWSGAGDGTTPRLVADVPKNYRADFSYEEDATAGLTTFKVTIARAGLAIIFR